MNVEDVRVLFAYNRWANHRLVAAAEELPGRDFIADLGASHSSIRGTLVHVLWAEWLWLQRWRSESPKLLFDPEHFPDVASILARWQSVEAEQQRFIDALTDDRLSGPQSYENLQGQRWQYSLGAMMQHLVNHSSYHRGQIAAFLRQLGRVPPATDFLVFIDDRDR